MATLTPNGMFRKAYPGGGTNFLTPRVLERGWIGSNMAYELSTGDSLFVVPAWNASIWGVTIVIRHRDGQVVPAWRDGLSLSKPFASREEAVQYIAELRQRNEQD